MAEQQQGSYTNRILSAVEQEDRTVDQVAETVEIYQRLINRGKHLDKDEHDHYQSNCEALATLQSQQ